MRRDDLIDRLKAIPAHADVGVRVGHGHLEIMDVVPWGKGRFGAVTCRPIDLKDLLIECGLTPDQRKRIMHENNGEKGIPMTAPEAKREPIRVAGIDELQMLLNLTPEQVQQLTDTAGFPDPMATLEAGRVWDLDDVDEWRKAQTKTTDPT